MGGGFYRRERERGEVEEREKRWRGPGGGQIGLPRSWIPFGHGDRSGEAIVTSPSKIEPGVGLILCHRGAGRHGFE